MSTEAEMNELLGKASEELLKCARELMFRAEENRNLTNERDELTGRLQAHRYMTKSLEEIGQKLAADNGRMKAQLDAISTIVAQYWGTGMADRISKVFES